MMRSANEITALIKRACLGFGFAHGAAADMAEAGTMLSLMGLDGCHAMRQSLSRSNPASPDKPASLSLDRENNAIHLAGGTIGHEGLAAADFITAYVASGQVQLQLSAFADTALLLARLLINAKDHNLLLEIGDAPLMPEARLIEELAAQDTLLIMARPETGLPAKDWSLPAARHCPVMPADWDWLMGYAMKTYVPASAQSRKSGAGAGETDND